MGLKNFLSHSYKSTNKLFFGTKTSWELIKKFCHARIFEAIIDLQSLLMCRLISIALKIGFSQIQQLTTVDFFLETRQKIFIPMSMVGKLDLNFHQPSCPADADANDAKIQIQFSRHWTRDFFGGFLR